MPNAEAPLEAVSLPVLLEGLPEDARTAHSRRAAMTVYGDRDTLLRQTALALQGGAELAEHDSPPEATLQVLSGRVRLRGHEREWELAPGDLMAIPPERHSVRALEDSVFLLSVRRASGARP